MSTHHFTTKPFDPPSDSKPDPLASLKEMPHWSRLISGKWQHQAEAIQFLESYLAMEKENREHAALVRMPTGTGKTGIMAVVANYFAALEIRNIVIIVPSDFLADQIRRALNVQFWVTVKGKPVDGPKPCVRFLPSTLQERLAELVPKPEEKLEEQQRRPAVYVCTTQTLYMLHHNLARKDSDPDRKETWAESYLELKRIANLVLVDEGHREPAKEWAKAVRSFSLPTILFTATPYRNDLRFFKVGPEDKFRNTFRFQEAVERQIIRNVHFEDTFGFGDNPGRFVDVLLNYFYGKFQSKIPAGVRSPKVIIRCEDFASLEKVRDLLISRLKRQKKTETVLAVHDRFPRNDEEELNFHDVPEENDATFWVHQFKLTEGLDNADFCLLAFFEPFSNARALVQQIGRVLRNPGIEIKESPESERHAIVVTDPTHALRQQWEGYLNFEASLRSLVGPEEIVERFLKSLPDWFYAGGRYRQAADFNSTTIDDDMLWNDLRLHKSASIYQLPDRFGREEFEALLSRLSDALEDEDIIEVRKLAVKKERGLLGAILSWRIVQTEALDEEGFFNVAFVPSVLYARSGFLFHSGPIGLAQLEEQDSLVRLAPSDMEKLLGTSPTLKQVSLISGDLSNAAVRRRSMGARSIVDIAPGLNDHFHFVSTAVGTFQNNGAQRRRYLGLSKGRVTEVEEKHIDIKSFKQWAQELVRQLRVERFRTPAVFNRFARNVRAPKTAEAAHLLLDLVEFFETYGERPEDNFPDTFEATACDVATDGTFKCVVGDLPITGSVTYSNPKKGAKRFVLQSESLDENSKLTNPQVGSRRQSASAYFTHRGVMRIVTTTRQLYADRNFYEPRVPFWGKGRLNHLELLFGVPELANISSEKGTTGKLGKGTWEAKSIFHFIDKAKEMYRLGDLKPQVLVCEDMGTEYADFIAVDVDRKRVALIHAKQCEGGLSAGDLHIVNSQVTKNLEFLNPTGSVGPERGLRWNRRWKWKRTDPDKKGLIRVRRVKPGMSSDGEDVFREIQTLIRRPSTEKEVWMVLGKGFSIKELKDKLEKPPYHVVHLAYLLQSCNANVSSVGAKLRIFTCP